MSGCARDGDQLTIAVVAPLSGPDASLGTRALNGARLAADLVNARSPDGRKVRIISRDERKAALPSLLSDLVRRERPVAVIGLTSSAALRGRSSPLGRDGVPTLVLWGSAGRIDPKLASRLGPSNEAMSKVLSAWLVASRGLKRVAIAASSTEKGSDGSKLISREVKRLGGDVVAEVSIEASTSDMTTVAQGLKSSGADALVVWAPPAAAARLCLAVRAIRWDVQIAGSDDLVDPEFRVLAGAASDDVAIVTPRVSPERWLSGETKDWLAAYHRRFTILPIADQRTLVTAVPYSAVAAYDAVNLVVEASRSKGNDREEVARQLRRKRSFAGVLNDYRLESGDAFEANDLQVSRFSNFALLADVEDGSNVEKQIAFYKVQVSGFFMSEEYLETAQGRKLSERVLEDVLSDPETVSFFKPYRPPLPAPGRI